MVQGLWKRDRPCGSLCLGSGWHEIRYNQFCRPRLRHRCRGLRPARRARCPWHWECGRGLCLAREPCTPLLYPLHPPDLSACPPSLVLGELHLSSKFCPDALASPRQPRPTPSSEASLLRAPPRPGPRSGRGLRPRSEFVPVDHGDKERRLLLRGAHPFGWGLSALLL